MSDEDQQHYQTPTPTCPHCGYAMTCDDMVDAEANENLFDAAPRESSVGVTCPSCDMGYWVQAGYTPHYTSAFSEEQLL